MDSDVQRRSRQALGGRVVAQGKLPTLRFTMEKGKDANANLDWVEKVWFRYVLQGPFICAEYFVQFGVGVFLKSLLGVTLGLVGPGDVAGDFEEYLTF